MTTQHIGDEDELVTAEQVENPGPPDPADNPVQPEPVANFGRKSSKRPARTVRTSTGNGTVVARTQGVQH